MLRDLFLICMHSFEGKKAVGGWLVVVMKWLSPKFGMKVGFFGDVFIFDFFILNWWAE